ncbi:MAG TPA: hypothetical protein VM101_14290 [Flavitalea sp.]|nr:hypothetical protein [Flavitalea sp.]
MQRRSFLKDAALGAVAISATGFIRFDGSKYIGDCETTTDILGPFYRPGSPVRANLVIAGDAGIKILLGGTVKHDDCITPFKKAKVEIWHCSAKGVYDNSTDEFRYRGTTFTDDKGNYSFNTILPVPYGVGNGIYRPAHFHLMITAEGYQPLVTQLYFAGDAYLSKDPSSSSPTAKRRILKVQTMPDKSKKLLFNINLSKKLGAEIAGIDKIKGVYSFENSTRKVEFFRNGKELWLKNQVFGMNLEYVGDNSFKSPLSEYDELFKFELQPDGKVKLSEITSAATLIAFKN